jgi:hypothetical protein
LIFLMVAGYRALRNSATGPGVTKPSGAMVVGAIDRVDQVPGAAAEVVEPNPEVGRSFMVALQANLFS